MLNVSRPVNNVTYDLEQQWAELLEASIDRSDWIRFMFLVFLILTFVAGVTGNLLTCIVIFFDKTMHTATNYYLFILAISDLLLAFGILLEIFVSVHNDQIFKFQLEEVCKVHFFLVLTLFNNGILIMTALAIERYVAIWHPLLLNSRPVWRRVMKVIIPIWIIAIFESLSEVWTVALVRTKTFSMCCIVPSTFARWLNGVLAVVNFIIPLIIMTFVYTSIAFKVNVVQKISLKDKVFNHYNNTSKINKLVALTLSFVGCWLPFFLERVLMFSIDLRKSPHVLQYWDLLYVVSSINCWFSIVLNPILFSLMSTKFRRALRKMWNSKFKRQTPVNVIM